MALKVTHELHDRRRGRNVGVGVSLAAFIAIVFGLTVVKMQRGDSLEAYDHVVRPGLIEEAQQ